MRRSRLQLRAPWNLVVGLVCFVALDAAIFKSGLYARIASPASMPGGLYYDVRFELARPRTPGVDEALVIGDSKIAEGFSPTVADAASHDAPLKLIGCPAPGISLRGIYYTLRRLDPAPRSLSHDRGAALDFYDAFPILDDELDERMLDADMLAPILGLGDYLDFVRSLPDRPQAAKALLSRLVGSATWAADVRDLLAHPQQRRIDVGWRTAAAEREEYAYDGRPEDMRGLAFEAATHTIRYPSRLTPSQRAAVDVYYEPLPEAESRRQADRFAAYVHRWTNRLVADYHGSRTTLVFVRMPEGPTPLPRLEPPAGAPSLVAELAGHAGVEVVDSAAFASLERPELYFDMLHLNAAGRAAFSRKLVEVLLRLARN